MPDRYYDDDRRDPLLTLFIVFCMFAAALVIACAPGGESSSQTACYEEIWRAEDIRPGHSCGPNQRLVTGQSGATTFVKCVCD